MKELNSNLPPFPKLCGADIELGNFILSGEPVDDSCRLAALAILREIPGVSHSPSYGVRSDDGDGRDCENNPQDWGRKYLPLNGGCVYIDLDHVELCLPECLSAFEHAAAWHAMLRIAQEALAAANENQPAGRRIQVLANNTDGEGHSYGSHLNFLVTRKTFDNVFTRKVHPMLTLAAYQASSIVFAGAGKAGSENGAPSVEYQISQRADFVETLVGPQTTFCRPLVNSRDEALCGRASRDLRGLDRASDLARLHVISYDSTLCHVSSVLKAGVYQLLLARIEAGYYNPALILEDPVDAIHRWSHDPSLQARAKTTCGTEVTAVEHQMVFLEDAKAFAARQGFVECVPRATEILSLWEDTLLKLKEGDLSGLVGRLDWVLKLYILDRAIDLDPKLAWSSPEIKHLDHLYSSLDRAEGLYWKYEAAGFVDRLVSDEEIHNLTTNAPAGTRAWTRALLLRWAGKMGLEIEAVDWDHIRLRVRSGSWHVSRTIDLANPLSFTRADVAPIVSRSKTLNDVLEGPRKTCVHRSHMSLRWCRGKRDSVKCRDTRRNHSCVFVTASTKFPVKINLLHL